MEDEHYNALKYYLETLEYPKDIAANLRRRLKGQHEYFFVNNDKIYRRSNGLPRLALKKNQAQEAIWMMHQHPLGGHRGIGNSIEKVQRRYWWPGLTRDVQDYIYRCERCQKQGKPSTIQEPLYPIPVKDEPFAQLGIDIKHVAESRDGSRYIVSAIDYLTCGQQEFANDYCHRCDAIFTG